MIEAKLRIVEYGDKRILAGPPVDDDESCDVIVPRNRLWQLHRVTIDDEQQALRSLLGSEQSEIGELTRAVLIPVLKTWKRPSRRPILREMS